MVARDFLVKLTEGLTPLFRKALCCDQFGASPIDTARVLKITNKCLDLYVMVGYGSRLRLREGGGRLPGFVCVFHVGCSFGLVADYENRLSLPFQKLHFSERTSRICDPPCLLRSGRSE